MNFFGQIFLEQQCKKSLLITGIDPDFSKIPEIFKKKGGLLVWGKRIVDETFQYSVAYKPNIAFFSACSQHELVLEKLIKYIHEKGGLVILDSKRGDIGNTAKQYSIETFDRYCADAVTLSPYLGPDTIEPYLKYEEKGLILLCRTSNPGASTFQNLKLKNGKRLYEQVAHDFTQWAILNKCQSRLGLVVGATAPKELRKVRKIVGDDIHILIPGIGIQSGDVEKTVKAGQNSEGGGIIISSSGAINYAVDPGLVANQTRLEINKHRFFV